MSVISDILDFSKIEAHQLDLEQVDFSLRESIHETMKTLALRAHEKGLELLADVRPQVPDRLRGDPIRLRQVLLNLVGNAIKFTKQGEIVVEVRSTEPSAEHPIIWGFRSRSDHIAAIGRIDGRPTRTRKCGGRGINIPF